MFLRTVFTMKRLLSIVNKLEKVAAQVGAAFSNFTDRCEKVRI